jgi:hypothetical protein
MFVGGSAPMLPSTVGWILPTTSFSFEKPSEFALSWFPFVSGFCIREKLGRPIPYAVFTTRSVIYCGIFHDALDGENRKSMKLAGTVYSRSALASLKSNVSNPSVNQP